MTEKDWERANLNVTLISVVCVCACVGVCRGVCVWCLGPIHRDSAGWGTDASVAAVLLGLPSRPAAVHGSMFSLTLSYMHGVLSLNNMAVVLETLTKVSVEASKQRNERVEKNQSTRQLTPVQNPGIYCTLRCLLQRLNMQMCVCLSAKDKRGH